MRIQLESQTDEASRLTGNIHSFESMGTVDGPGIRFVVFMAGCPLRCKYCHNIDVVLGKGEPYTVEQVLQKIRRSTPYFTASGGGVTLTGGDAIMQPGFVYNLFTACKQEGIHTCLDTSLMAPWPNIERLLPVTDLWLVSVKHMDATVHKKLTGSTNSVILENITKLCQNNALFWLRYLVLPTYTDTTTNINAFIEFTSQYTPIQVELLPYHTVGKQKWNALELRYDLDDVPTPSAKQMQDIKSSMESIGCPIILNEYDIS